MKLLRHALAAALLAASTASAQTVTKWVDVDTLRSICITPPTADAVCTGYVVGVTETAIEMMVFYGTIEGSACTVSVTPNMLVHAVRDHFATQNSPNARTVVVGAIRESYPCLFGE